MRPAGSLGVAATIPEPISGRSLPEGKCAQKQLLCLGAGHGGREMRAPGAPQRSGGVCSSVLAQQDPQLLRHFFTVTRGSPPMHSACRTRQSKLFT